MEGRCVFANKKFYEIFYFTSKEEIIGSNIHDLIHSCRPDGSTYPGHECKILKNIRRMSGAVFGGEELFFRNDDTCFPAECRVFPIKHHGKTIGGVMNIIDVTSRKNLLYTILR